MRGILIDPETKSVREVETTGDNKAMYELLNCTIVEVIKLTNTTDLWIDEEGLLKENPGPFFALRGNEYSFICGRGLILDRSKAGNCMDTQVTTQQAIQAVLWPNVEFIGFEPYEGEQEFLGKMVPVIGSRAVFKLRA